MDSCSSLPQRSITAHLQLNSSFNLFFLHLLLHLILLLLLHHLLLHLILHLLHLILLHFILLVSPPPPPPPPPLSPPPPPGQHSSCLEAEFFKLTVYQLCSWSWPHAQCRSSGLLQVSRNLLPSSLSLLPFPSSLAGPRCILYIPLPRLAGSFAISGSQDCTVKLWNLKSVTKWSEVA